MAHTLANQPQHTRSLIQLLQAYNTPAHTMHATPLYIAARMRNRLASCSCGRLLLPGFLFPPTLILSFSVLCLWHMCTMLQISKYKPGVLNHSRPTPALWAHTPCTQAITHKSTVPSTQAITHKSTAPRTQAIARMSTAPHTQAITHVSTVPVITLGFGPQPGKAVPGSHLPTGHIGQLNQAQSKASARPMYSKFRTPSPSEDSHVVPKHQLRRYPPPPRPKFFF